MGTSTAMRQFLKSLCNNSCWKYTVFWKLNHRSRMLTWEDGYCDYLNLRETMGNVSDDIYFSSSTNKMFPPKPETSSQDGSSSGCPIARAVADMAYLQYALGEGVVGKVAYTGNHFWCFSDDILSGESNLVSECPDEWLLQFVGGIKTILLIPVIPHGVLQFGSLETVGEDLALVAYIKDRFNALQNGISIPFTSSSNLVAQPSSLLISGLIENLDETPVITNSIPNIIQPEDLKPIDSVENNKFSTINQVRPFFTIQDDLQEFGNTLPNVFKGESENESDVLLASFIKEEASQGFSVFNNLSVEPLGELFDGIINGYSDRDMIEQLYGDNYAIDVDHATMSSSFSFPTDCELHQAFGPVFHEWANGDMRHSSITGEDSYSSSSLIFNRNLTDSIEPSAFESSGWSAKGDEANLLEAVVTNVCGGFDDTTLSERSNYVHSFKTSVERFDDLSQAQNPSEQNALLGEDSVPWSRTTSALISGARKAPTSVSSSENMLSRLFDEQLQTSGYGLMQSRKGAKLSKVNKRRSIPGDNQRPRPRDRQMIQDRVKELRELVPNGAKCSIDGLLDRTIKHMMFLRNVTDRAEKFRQWTHHEVPTQSNRKSSETKNAEKIGTSWAFQLGSELEVCPIVVEDLEYPGHMLVKMLCNEHGLFLEIAQVIRGLELTILEGVIENHSGSTWARFIVEVSPGFHRMDIFWPLMHLLQRERSKHPISSKI